MSEEKRKICRRQEKGREEIETRWRRRRIPKGNRVKERKCVLGRGG